MEYDFYKTPDGLFEAEFSTEQEYFGQWLTHELADDKNKIVDLLNIIVQLKKRQIKDHKIIGAELTLVLNQDEAIIHNNATPIYNAKPQDKEESHDDSENYVDEDNSSNDDHQDLSPDALENGCGLDDFSNALSAWLNFIQPN